MCMENYIIETKGLVKKYNDSTVVNNVDLMVKKGEIYGLLGSNGAGKSTIIKLILGLIKPTSGNINVFGESINKKREEILKNIGALVEEVSYYSELTAYENLKLIKGVLNLPEAEIEEKLKMVNLWEDRDKKVKKFSLGMKQRLGIAQALMGNPQLLILDEPTNGLDPSGIIEIRNLIKSLANEKKVTIIVCSHILSEIEKMCTQVALINKGNLIYQGSLTNLKKIGDYQVVIGFDAVEDKSKVTEYMRKKGYKFSEKLGKFVIENKIAASVICKEMIMNNFRVNYLSEEKGSLEDVFLELTEGDKEC